MEHPKHPRAGKSKVGGYTEHGLYENERSDYQQPLIRQSEKRCTWE